MKKIVTPGSGADDMGCGILENWIKWGCVALAVGYAVILIIHFIFFRHK